MNVQLISVAVAEYVFEWTYDNRTHEWIHPDGHRSKLGNWWYLFKACDVLKVMRDIYKLRATIEYPMREGGVWWVKLRSFDGVQNFEHCALTVDEAILRCSLLARGVEVDD